jgi:hypothetical protein
LVSGGDVVWVPLVLGKALVKHRTMSLAQR